MQTTDSSPPTLAGFFWSQRRRFAPGLAVACGRIAAIAALPLIFRRIIDQEMPAKNLAGIALWSGLTVALLFVHQWFSVRGAARLGRAVTQMSLDLRARLFEKIQYLSFAYLDRNQAGKLLAKYAFDTQKIEGVAMPILNGFVPNTLYSLLTLGILITMNWRLATVVLLLLPIFAIMRRRYFGPLQQVNQANRVALEAFTGTASEYLGALRLVRSYGKEASAADELIEKDEAVARTRVAMLEVGSSFGAFSWGSVQFLSLVVIAGGAALNVVGQVTPGVVLAFVAGLPALVQPIQAFSAVADQYFIGREAYRSTRELLDEPDTEAWRGTRTLSPIRGRIEFDRVTFRYAGAATDALHDFSLTIQPGERVALVGASGAGKSTVAGLLLGLYHATGGEIRIDGVPQAALDMRWLRRHAAVVMQESVLLSGTVADNIRFARAGATDEQVRDAARQANAEAFILAMPDGFETRVGERGATLSGGQRQRIAIARALLRDPAILILDEPTSALDYESERLIQQAIEGLSRGRTVMTIAHRLSTIQRADRIVVLEGGQLSEQGTFAELVARGGAFARMYAATGDHSTLRSA